VSERRSSEIILIGFQNANGRGVLPRERVDAHRKPDFWGVADAFGRWELCMVQTHCFLRGTCMSRIRAPFSDLCFR
jgi:hypothetical protein